jgi:hypothetical protein
VPKRTNLFQQIVATVYKQIGGESVEESVMVPDKIAGTDREVDVVITSHVAGEKITVGVEATAISRKLDLKAVQGIIAKHEAIGTNQMIIVSESGFTGPARRTIDSTLGISGYQPTDLNNEKQLEAKVVGRLSKLWPRRFSVTLTTVFAEMVLPDSLQNTNVVSITRPPLNFPLLDWQGNEITSPEGIFRHWANTQSEDVMSLLDVANTTEDTDKTFLKELFPPWKIHGQEITDLYVMVDTNIDPTQEPTPEPLRLLKLDLRGPVSIRVSEVDLRHQQLNDEVAYSVGQTVLDGKSILMVASATAEGEKVTTLELAPASAKPQRATQSRRGAKKRRNRT